MEISIKGLEQEFLTANFGSKEFKIDISQKYNLNIGPNPLEIFLTALCACISVYTKRYLKDFPSALKDISVKVFGDLTLESPYRFSDLKVEINLPFDLGQRKHAFLNFVKNCPVHNTLAKSVHIDFEIRE